MRLHFGGHGQARGRAQERAVRARREVHPGARARCDEIRMPGAAVLTKGAALMRRCVAVFGIDGVVQHLRHEHRTRRDGGRDVIDRIAGIDDRLCVAEELLIQREARIEAFRREAVVDHRPEGLRVAEQVRNAAARHVEIGRDGRDRHRVRNRAHDAAERDRRVVDLRRIDVRHRVAVEVEVRQRLRELHDVDRALRAGCRGSSGGSSG